MKYLIEEYGDYILAGIGGVAVIGVLFLAFKTGAIQMLFSLLIGNAV